MSAGVPVLGQIIGFIGSLHLCLSKRRDNKSTILQSLFDSVRREVSKNQIVQAMRGTAELSGVSVRLQQSLQGVHTRHLPYSCRLLCIRIQGITSATGKSYRQITRTIFSSRWCASVSQEKRLYSVEYVYMCVFWGTDKSACPVW